MSARKSTERADDMIARHEAGETLDAIGKSYGVSRQRVLQIIRARQREIDEAEEEIALCRGEGISSDFD